MRKTKEKEENEKKEDDPKRTPLSNELALFCTHETHTQDIYIYMFLSSNDFGMIMV